ncbi:MAG: TolC family protein [Deltaproteobacteria bacterium]|nr:TolC family protein [Deltaproteobacteria bacterium]
MDGERRRRTIKRVLSGIELLAAVLVLAGCAQNPPNIYGVPGTSPSPAAPWKAPATAIMKPAAAKASPTLPQDILKSVKSLTLFNIVDIALRNNPDTAAAWEDARSAAAAYGSELGAYYPQIGATGDANWLQDYSQQVRTSFRERSYSAAVQLNWLLFDFGGREALVDESRLSLMAADWTHNAAIQTVMLNVETAYYNYVSSKALFEAQQATYRQAETNLDAARDRHHAGVATIADVLQAKTALAQAKLALDSLEGQIQTTRGALATAMGIPANAPYDIEIPRNAANIEETLEKVDTYLALAEEQRPDLAAARAQAAKAEAHVRRVRAEAYPSINGAASWGRTRYDNTDVTGSNYGGSIQVSVPIFTGLSQSYNVFQAQADEKAARARLSSLEQQVVLQVWTSYYNLKTAVQRVRTTEDLLESATESYDVALGRYRAGVGSILDLLSAQSALEGARAQRVQANADWYVSLAQLARDTGTLNISSTGPASGGPAK